MGNTPYPLPRATRQSDILDCDGVSLTYGPFNFKIFDLEDVTVWLRPTANAPFAEAAVTVAKAAGEPFDDFTITFATLQPATADFIVSGSRTHERQYAITKGSALDTDQLEKELSKQGAVLQEWTRDLGRAVKAPPGSAGPDIALLPEGHFWIADADGNMVDGGNGSDIADAQANATSTADDAAATAADRLLAQAAAAAAAGAAYTYASLSALLAATTAWPDGTVLLARDGAHAYKKVGAAADLVRGDGVHIEVLTPDLAAFGIVGDGVTDETALVLKATTRFAGKTVAVPAGFDVVTTLTEAQLKAVTWTGYGTVRGASSFRVKAAAGFSLPSPMGSTAGGRIFAVNPESITFTGAANDAGVILGGRGTSASYQVTVGPNAELYLVGGGGDHFIDQLAGTIVGGAHHDLGKNAAGSPVGSHGIIGGGSEHKVHGDYSGVFAGSQNWALSSYNYVFSGVRCRVGDDSNATAVNYAGIFTGLDNTIVSGGHYGFIPFGRKAEVSAYFAQASGYGASAYLWGMRTHQSNPFDAAAANAGTKNDNAAFEVNLGLATTGANSGIALQTFVDSAGRQLTIPDGYQMTATGILHSWRTDVVERSAWKVEFIASAAGGVTTIHASSVTAILTPGGTYAVDVQGAASLNIIQVRVRSTTGATIRWSGRLIGHIMKGA